jgi:hypothetical protein
MVRLYCGGIRHGPGGKQPGRLQHERCQGRPIQVGGRVPVSQIPLPPPAPSARLAKRPPAMTAAPPQTNSCSRLPRQQRAACKREQALALQRSWLAQLTWDGGGTAAQVQLWLGVFPVNWRQLPDVGLLKRQIATIRRHLGAATGSCSRQCCWMRPCGSR